MSLRRVDWVFKIFFPGSGSQRGGRSSDSCSFLFLLFFFSPLFFFCCYFLKIKIMEGRCFILEEADFILGFDG